MYIYRLLDMVSTKLIRCPITRACPVNIIMLISLKKLPCCILGLKFEEEDILFQKFKQFVQHKTDSLIQAINTNKNEFHSKERRCQ